MRPSDEFLKAPCSNRIRSMPRWSPPRGRAEVTVVFGGLDVHDPVQETTHVIATAAVAALLPIEGADWRLTAGN